MANEQVLTAEQVIDNTKRYLNEEDVAFVQKAYDFAKEAHKEQYRKSGEPYIIHPIQVAGILVDLDMDPATIAAGFLHDVVEDTEITLKDLEKIRRTFYKLLLFCPKRYYRHDSSAG